MSRFERGAVAPSLQWVERLAELYGTSIDTIYGAALDVPTAADPQRTELWEFVQRLRRDQATVVLALGKAYVEATQPSDGPAPGETGA